MPTTNITIDIARRREYEATTAARWAWRARHEPASGAVPLSLDVCMERTYVADRARFARYAIEGGRCTTCGETITTRREGRCGGAPGSEHTWVAAVPS